MKSEFKIISGTTKQCEETLNEWHQDYRISIIEMCATEFLTIILLERLERE